MDDLNRRLTELGLDEYYNILVDQGFDSWEKVTTITETQLDSLDVKRGHRRVLQRRIWDLQGHPSDQPLPRSSATASSSPQHSQGGPAASPAAGIRSESSQSNANSNGTGSDTVLPSIERADGDQPAANG